MVIRKLVRFRITLPLFILLATLGASAQNSDVSYADVKTWYGSYTYKASAKENKKTFEASFEGTFVLTQNKEEPNWWDGKIESGRGRVEYKYLYDKDCTASMVGSGPTVDIDPSTIDPEVRLRLWPDNWDLNITKAWVPAAIVTCPSGNKSNTTLPHPFFTEGLPYPQSGSGLDRKFKVMFGAAGFWAPFTWEGEVHLSPTRDDFKLEVETKDHTIGKDYRTWRPSATATGGRGGGEAIAFTATLKRKSGAPAGVEVSRMEWELVNTSKEPGIAINYPLNATNRDADMRFDPKTDQQSRDPDRQTLTSTNVKQGADTASILPFDWGGWSTLRVTAHLANGKKVVGKLIDTGDEEIRLPRRRSGSFIADAWREKKTKPSGDDGCLAGAESDRSGADDGDNEKDNERGGFPGDGLTLYEEYRGFYEKGQHKCGDPSKRDLFVIDETNSVKGGIAKFAKESGIVVHSMQPDEFDKSSRIVNKNYQSGPHLLDQHGIRVVWMDSTEYKDNEDASGAFIATAPQNARSPGDVQYLLIPRTLPLNPPAADGTPYNDVSFSHEMMHAVGVRHHGDKKDFEVYWKIEGKVVKEYIQEADESLSGPGVEITILRKDGSNATSDFIAYRKSLGGKRALGQKQSVGVTNGKGSGDDTCMMRYDRFSAYLIAGRPNVRVRIAPKENPEPVGYTICKRRNGTGINAPPAEKSRYGDASVGDCAGQMRVRDLK